MWFHLVLIPDNINLYYPFFFRPMFDIMEDGWQAYLPETEFGRLKASTDEWRLSHVNRSYEVTDMIQYA